MTATEVADAAGTAITAALVQLNTANTSLNSILAESHYYSFPAPGMPAKPSVSRTFAATFTGIATQMTTINNALSGLAIAANSLTIPAYGSTETPIWSETYWTNLKTTLTNMIGTVTTSSNVDALITQLTVDSTKTQVAIYAADRDRKQQALRDSFSAASASTGSRGFTYPNSMTTALKLSAQQQYMFDLAQTSRDIIKQIFEWAKTSYQFSIEKQVNVHAADVEFNMQYRRMAEAAFANEAQRLLLEYKTKMSEKVVLVEQAMNAYRLAFDALQLDATIGREEIDLQLKEYGVLSSVAIQNSQAYANTNAPIYQARLKAAESAVNAITGAVAASSQSALAVFNG